MTRRRTKADHLLLKIGLALFMLQGCAGKQQQPAEVVMTKRMYQFYFASKTDTIDTVSKKYNMTTDELIRINQLQAPFVLHDGQRLHVHKRAFDMHRDEEERLREETLNGRRCVRPQNAYTMDEKPPQVEYSRKRGWFWPVAGIAAVGATLAAALPKVAKAVGPSTSGSAGGGAPGPSGGPSIGIDPPGVPRGPMAPPGYAPGYGPSGPYTPGGIGVTPPGVNISSGSGGGASPSRGGSGGGGGSLWPLAAGLGAVAAAPLVAGAAMRKSSTQAAVGGCGRKQAIAAAPEAATAQCSICSACDDPLRLAWPLNNNVRAIKGGYKNGGILIINSEGERYVRPALDGYIASITFLSKDGFCQVIIDHPLAKVKTVYQGMVDGPLGYKIGDSVTTKDVIGAVRHNNDATLFFQLLEDGKPVDPQWFLGCPHAKNPYR